MMRRASCLLLSVCVASFGAALWQCGSDSGMQSQADSGADASQASGDGGDSGALADGGALPDDAGDAGDAYVGPVAVELTIGDSQTCFLAATGDLKCWGYNDLGVLGDGTNQASAVPHQVVGLTSGVASAGPGNEHTCAILADGTAKCWGLNASGELGQTGIDAGGDSGVPFSLVPVTVPGVTDAVSIESGAGATCIVTSGGGVKCWGDNSLGMLGRPTNGGVDFVTGLTSGYKQVSVGSTSACAVSVIGTVKCWGVNGDNQLGVADPNERGPVDVAGLTDVVAVSSGRQNNCALTSTGGVKCWGSNALGALGSGTDAGARSYTPLDVQGLTSGVARLSVGNGHACVLTSASGVKCWGAAPADVAGLTSGVAAITAGDGYDCVLMKSGTIECWGLNSSGQLGDGTMNDSPTPVTVMGIP